MRTIESLGCALLFVFTLVSFPASVVAQTRLPVQTFRELATGNEYVVIAELESKPSVAKVSDEESLARLRIVCDLKDALPTKPGVNGPQQGEVLELPLGNRLGEVFMLSGKREKKKVRWRIEEEFQRSSIAAIKKMFECEKVGIERLRFFNKYIHHSDPMLAHSAQLEFVTAEVDVFGQLDSTILDRVRIRRRLGRLLKKTGTYTTRFQTQLHWALLAKCATQDDAVWIEEQMQKIKQSSDEKEMIRGGMVACYLSIAGDPGVERTAELFFDRETDILDTYNAILGMRHFVKTEGSNVSQSALISAFRRVLKNPNLADLVIHDLATLEDWESMDLLVQIFKRENAEWCRVPIMNYLRLCPKDKALRRIQELKAIDLAAFKKSEVFFDIDDETIAEVQPFRVANLRPNRPSRGGWGC